MNNLDLGTNFNDVLEKGSFLVKGSEAYIYLGNFLGKKVIIKERRAKKYRHEALDAELRLERMKLEVRILNTATNSLIPVPAVIAIQPEKFYLILEYIEGITLGDYLKRENCFDEKKQSQLFQKVGALTGQLHSLNIIHGDLSIHNVIVKSSGELVFIDFGLSSITDELELLASDIYTFETTLRAFDPQNVEKWFLIFLSHYKDTFSNADNVLEQFTKILSRGRYINRKVT